ILDGMRAAGIENVLALRGDPPRGQTEWRAHPGGLHYSTELAALIRDGYPFSVGAACFPEIHPEAPDLAADLHFLKQKVDAGDAGDPVGAATAPAVGPARGRQDLGGMISSACATIGRPASS